MSFRSCAFPAHIFPALHQNARINYQITAAELRVIDPEGKNLGVLALSEALSLARDKFGLDLIEISPTAKPPVARIMSFDKYRYEAEKARKKERQLQKASGMKQVQISARAAHNDFLIKARQTDEFLNADHQIEINFRLRGREKKNRAWADERLKEFLGLIQVEYKVSSPPRFGGRGMSMQILKK